VSAGPVYENKHIKVSKRRNTRLLGRARSKVLFITVDQFPVPKTGLGVLDYYVSSSNLVAPALPEDHWRGGALLACAQQVARCTNAALFRSR
jgi:hypothetical protein